MPDSPANPHTRTPEQEAAVRRRALPVSIAALICGAAGLAILLKETVSAIHLPAFLGINLCFCAMLMGIGILFYAKGTPRTGLAAILCLISIMIGFAGTMVFMRDAVYYRKAAEETELANLSAIANAARQYAQANGGVYPASTDVLVKVGRLPETRLHSPYQGTSNHPDYQYLPGDLRLTSPAATGPSKTQVDLLSQVVVVARWDPIERKSLTLAYADGRSEFLDEADALRIWTASNKAREALGFHAVEEPKAFEHPTTQQ